MCEFCLKHKRKKWFLDEENFEEKLLENKKRMNVLQKIATGWEYYLRDSSDIVNKWTKYPLIDHLSRMLINKLTKYEHGGQVITLTDALEIVDLADNHVVFPCACRKLVSLKEKDCCICFGPMKYLSTNINEKMEEVDTEELKLRLKDWHKEGLVHQVLYATAPFPIAICNCERKYCIAMKHRLISNIQMSLLKGHEVAIVDPIKCEGCEEFPCMSRCQFGAMYVDRYDDKVVIDPTKCFGCGLCVSYCKYRAITLKPREEVLGQRIKW